MHFGVVEKGETQREPGFLTPTPADVRDLDATLLKESRGPVATASDLFLWTCLRSVSVDFRSSVEMAYIGPFLMRVVK